MKTKQAGKHTEFLLNMLLFCAFAFLALAVLLAGARAYRTFAARIEDNFTSRTAAGYVTNKVRQYDAQGAITLVTLPGEVSALSLVVPEQPDYCTLIYYEDGAVRELFARTDAAVDLSSGMEIVKAQGLSFALVENRLTATVLGASARPTTFQVAVLTA